LLYFSDVVLHPVQVEKPGWHSVIDLYPEQLEATRQGLLAQAASDETLVLAFHFPFPGLGHVAKKKEKWEPCSFWLSSLSAPRSKFYL
jgi:hypothetical protein